MSQSDYLRYKRVSHVLREQEKLPAVLSNNDYVQYKSFTIENKIQSDTYVYYKVLPPSLRIVWGMERPRAPQCAVFPVETPLQRLNQVPKLDRWLTTPARPWAAKTWQTKEGYQSTLQKRCAAACD